MVAVKQSSAPLLCLHRSTVCNGDVTSSRFSPVFRQMLRWFPSSKLLPI
jgi:hypothetical protein